MEYLVLKQMEYLCNYCAYTSVIIIVLLAIINNVHVEEAQEGMHAIRNKWKHLIQVIIGM